MASDPRKLQSILEAAVPDVPLAFRPMFGGIVAYAEGKPFVSLSDVGLALKLAPDDFAQLLKTKGTKPLRYEPDAPPSKSYVVVSPAILKDPSVLHDWVLRSVNGTKAPKKQARRARV